MVVNSLKCEEASVDRVAELKLQIVSAQPWTLTFKQNDQKITKFIFNSALNSRLWTFD